MREGRCTHPVGVWGTAWPPYSLATIGGRMLALGYDVRLVDAAVGDVTRRTLTRLLQEYEPDLVFMATSAPTYPSDLEVIAEIRKVSPGCRIGVFGVHSTADPDSYLRFHSGADFVVRGEPETACEKVVRSLERERVIKPLPGISVRDAETVIHGPTRSEYPDAGESWRPDWSLVRTNRYRLPFLKRPYLSVATSRGCPFSCTFCTQHLYYGSKVRTRPPEEIVSEIEDLRSLHGVRDFFLWSECFTADRDYARAVCEALRTVGGISWVATTRVDCVDPELLRDMREAGCWMIGFGIESGDQTVLDLCRKGHTVEQSRDSVRWAEDAGLLVLGHFVFGLPGETRRSAERTLKTALEMRLNFAQFHRAAPYPGTELHDWWRRNDPGASANDHVVSQERASISTEDMSAAEVDRWSSRARWRFYLRGRFMWTLLRLSFCRKAKRANVAASNRGVLSNLVVEALNGKRITVVIPALDEERTIREVVAECRRWVGDVVVVDGDSTDRTRQYAERSGARVVHLKDRGKGVALCEAIARENADILVFMDADGSHLPSDIPRLVEPIVAGRADLVIGCRATGGSDELGETFSHIVRAMGSRVIQKIVNLWYGSRLSDIQNGFRAIRTDTARKLRLQEEGFCIDQEMVIRSLMAGYRVLNVPSHERQRRHGKSRLRLLREWPRFITLLVDLMHQSGPRVSQRQRLPENQNEA